MSDERRQQNRSILSIYIDSGGGELIPIYPFYAVMFMDHGVSPFGFSVLLVVWSLSAMAAEIPSGALADRFSRKWLMVLGSVLKSAAFGVWFLWQDFFGYMLGFVVWGSGSALRSGAWEALLYDLLKQWGREGEYTRVYGRAVGLGTTAVAVGMLLGGATIVLGYDRVLLISMAVPVVTALPLVIWVTDAHREGADRERRFQELLRLGMSEALTNRTALYILLISTGLLAMSGTLDEFVSPLLKEKGFAMHWLGYLGAAIFLSLALGQFLAHRFRAGRLTAMVSLVGLAGLLLFGAVLTSGYPVTFFLAFFFFALGFCDTLMAARLQSSIGSDARATVTSVVGFSREIGHIATSLAFGWIALDFGIGGGTFATAVATVSLSIAFIVLARRWHIPERGDE